MCTWKCMAQANILLGVLSYTKKQESPPAWTQEAYHPPCSDYSFCCPILADHPPSWLDLTPPGRLDLTPSAGPDPPSWTWPPPLAGPDPPPAGPDPPGQLDLTPPSWVEWVLTPPCGQTESWMDGQTRVKTLPSPILRMRAVITSLRVHLPQINHRVTQLMLSSNNIYL